MKQTLLLLSLAFGVSVAAHADDCGFGQFAVPIQTCITVLGVDICWTTIVCENNPGDWMAAPARNPDPWAPEPKEVDKSKTGSRR